MGKKNKAILSIFMEAIGLYFSNFDKFIKYMSFPVLGQIVGLLLIFILTYFYAQNMPILIQKFSVFDNYMLLVGVLILLILPGLVIFIKSFWEYLVAYGALNSMYENMQKSGKVYDFDAHTELIKRRTLPFIGLWFLFGVFSLFSICPLLWVVCAVFAVFFVLVFQVFTFEPELTPLGCVKKSLILVKGHFASTFTLMALVGALTYVLIPNLANQLFAYVNATNLFASWVEVMIKDIPLDVLNGFLSKIYLQPLDLKTISLFAVSVTITQIFIQFTLPLRSILWAMWYKELNGALPKLVEKKSAKKSKTPSEKLMKESHKKFTSKKLDRNILKRAMQKDEES